MRAEILNLMRKQVAIPVTQFTGLRQKTVSITGTALTELDLNVMDDDSAATNGTKVYLQLERGVTEQGMLVSEMDNGATVNVESDTGSLNLPVLHKPVEDATITMKDDDSAASNGVAVYAVPVAGVNEWGVQECNLVFVSPTNADGTMNTSTPTDTINIYDNDGAADLPGAMALTFDEDAASTDERFLVNNPNAVNCYVRLKSGRLMQLKHAASGGVQVYLDEDGATAAERFLFVSPTDGDGSGVTGTADGMWAIDGLWIGAVYFDDDAATEGDRLLCNIPAAVDAHVFLTSGNRMLKVTYDATPDGEGVLLYIDDDAAEATERFLAVNAGDADSTVQLSPTYQVFDDEGGATVATITEDTVLASALDDDAVLDQVSTTGHMALLMNTNGQRIVHKFDLAELELDRRHDIRVYVQWISQKASAAGSVLWKVFHLALDTETTALAVPSTALDTALVADVPVGTADVPQRTAAGVIDANTLTLAMDELVLMVEMDTKTSHSENIYFDKLIVEYTRRLSRTGEPVKEATEWRP